MVKRKPPRILVVGGSDSGGGAGIEADLKTVTVLGGYGLTAITALTAQNTKGIQASIPTPPGFLKTAIRTVVSDIGVDAIKTGMLPTPDCVKVVAGEISKLGKKIPVVIDPVLKAKGGRLLSDEAAYFLIKTRLIPFATVFTPNVPEAEVLTGLKIRNKADMALAGKALLTMGAKAVLLKGGHLKGETITDLLVTPTGVYSFTSRRIKTRHSHGTGCTLASSLALYLASGLEVKKAVAKARNYVLKALAAAPGFGAGFGPMGHNLGRTIFD